MNNNLCVKSLNQIDINKVIKKLSRQEAEYHELLAVDIIKAYRNLVEIQKHTIIKAIGKIRELRKDKTN